VALLYALHIESHGWDGTVGEKKWSASILRRLRGYGGGIRTPLQCKGVYHTVVDVLESKLAALFVAGELALAR
jgi:hypothetical protein